MQKLVLVVPVCVAIFATGCELKTPETQVDKMVKPQLIGRWFREARLREEDGTELTLLENKTGDRFEANFKVLRKDDIPRQAAWFGKWYVVEGLYKHRTELRNGIALDRKNLSAYSTYRIVSISATEFVLEEPLAHHILAFRKVGSDFRMP